MSYKDMFDKAYFGTILIGATKNLADHIWTGTNQERKQYVKEWIETASIRLGLEKPRFTFIDGAIGNSMYSMTGGGEYIKDINTIVLYRKYSLVTLLHEFAHVIDCYAGKEPDEEFARGWSVSLFYIVAPDKYARAVEMGTLKFM